MFPIDPPFSRRLAALVAVSLVLLSSFSGVAAAQSTGEFGGTIVIEEGETVDGLEGVAGTIVVRGTVAGDLSGTAGTVRITETGTVEGDVEVAAGSVVVDGTVEGNVEAGAGSFDLTSTGTIGGTLDVGAGAASVDGTVGGDVRASGSTVTLGPNADVGGEFRYDAQEFVRSPDASVAGGVVKDPSLGGGSGFSLPSGVGTAYGFATSFLLGAVLLVVVPGFTESVATLTVDGPAVAGGVGLLTLFGVPVLLVLVAITIVGIPFAIAGIAVYALGLWVAGVYGKYAVGRWVLGRTDQESRWLALVTGLVLFLLLGFVPILGSLAEFLVLLLGLGALVLVLRDRYSGVGDAEERPAGVE